MSNRPEERAAAVALERLRVAFADRTPPAELTNSKQLSDAEVEEVMSFDGLRWHDVTFVQVHQHADAVFWLAPEAFCYYLPGILAAGLRAQRSDTNAYDSVVGCLDRSPEPANWDDFFRPRWTRFTIKELEAIASWVVWLEIVAPDLGYPGTYDRVLATLALLQERAPGA